MQKEQVDNITKIERFRKATEISKLDIENWKEKNQQHKEEVAHLNESLKIMQAEKETNTKDAKQTQTQFEEMKNELEQECENKLKTNKAEYQQQLQELQDNSTKARNALEEQIATMQTDL